MDKTYQPHNIEKQCYDNWEAKGYFSPKGGKENYCIMLPPPNVTGHLHMGHGFQQTLMDALSRYHRMKGDNTLWQGGTDHAGIATQMVVERQLQEQGIKRTDIGREAFTEKVWQWKETSGNAITKQIRRLGASIDWQRECFTMDDGLSDAVLEVFERLYDEGLIYRGTRLVNWDPKFHTAISDLEVLNEEEQGHLWHLSYPVIDSDESLVVATSRPETLFGDSAVAVNPKDKRYKHLIGKHIALPLTTRIIPIIADDYANPEFGTGCVKITPAHDFNDYEVGKRHDLPLINILTKDAHLNDQVPSDYQGLERFAARKKVIEELTVQKVLVKTEDHTVKIPRGDRSGVVIEPYLTDQWYVQMKPLADPAIDAVKTGKVKFVPDNWNKIYFNWLENIEDWCISRQLWWGHRIPAWYDPEGKIYVGKDETHVRKKYKLDDNVQLEQDQDVLDTWFSSSLWPFTTLGWPEKTEELKLFYPSSVLVTGFDIIFFWVARMIMMGLKFMDDVPFKEVYVHGLIRDNEGQKMSKSKGNVLDPIDLIDGIDLESLVSKRTQSMMQPHLAKKIEKATRKQFPDGIEQAGCDALRFTYCAMASYSQSIRFDLQRLESNRNFCNKLWNATRYVLMNTEGQLLDNTPSSNLVDQWILSKLQHTIEQAHNHFESYRFDLLTQCLYEFIWNEYCDWYLELSKPIIYSEQSTDTQKAQARYTLLYVLDNIVRLLHPLMPFISETIWQQIKTPLNKEGETIMLQAYPEKNSALIHASAEIDVAWLKEIVVGIRTIRSEMNVSPAKAVPLFIANGSKQDQIRFKQNHDYLTALAKLSAITWLDKGQEAPVAATALVGDMELLIPLAGLIDKEAELARLKKEVAKLEGEIKRFESKLGNSNFVAKAPTDVVASEKQKLSECQKQLEQFKQQVIKIKAL
jgi:valyl-tRNA synthetase